jgi:hypothetical protein
MSEQQRWDENLEKYFAAIRSSVHESTKFTPYNLMFGQEMCLSGNYPPASQETSENIESTERMVSDDRTLNEARKNVKTAQRNWKTQYDKKTRPANFQIGDRVFRKNFKLSNKIEGYSAKQGPKNTPCTIIGKIASDIYRTKDDNGKEGTYHANVLMPASKIVTRSQAKKQEIDSVSVEKAENSKSWLANKTSRIRSAIGNIFEQTALKLILG